MMIELSLNLLALEAAGDSASVAVGRRQVVDKVLDPGVVGVADGRRAVAPAHVVGQQFSRPVRDVERRIGEDVVGLEVEVRVAQEAVGGLQSQGWPRCRGMARMCASRQVVGLDSWPKIEMSVFCPPWASTKRSGLHEHAGRAAAGVVDAALVCSGSGTP